MRSSLRVKVTLTSTVSARIFWLSFREYVVSPCSCQVFSSARLIAPFSLQKWEAKVIASHVAEFEAPPAQAPPQYPPHPMHVMPQHYSNAFVPQPPPAPPNMIKKEPVDSRFIMSGQYVPPMASPQIPALRPPPNSLLTFPAGPSRPPVPVAAPAPALAAHPPATAAQPVKSSQPTPTQSQSQNQPARIPQVDGPSSSSSDSSSPPPQQYAPHSSHPSLPQPTPSSTVSADDEAINSDLDDSDSEGEEDPDEGPGVSDIVFCTYDKVMGDARCGNTFILIVDFRLLGLRTSGS